MSERYWITGVQLGLLQVLPSDKRKRLIDEIIDKQFIGSYRTDKEQKDFAKEIKHFRTKGG